jgi:hypothetical protein
MPKLLVTPLNANSPDFWKVYDGMSVINATVRIALERPGFQRFWSVVFAQEGRKMIQTYREPDNATYDQALLQGANREVRWTHISGENPNRRLESYRLVGF